MIKLLILHLTALDALIPSNLLKLEDFVSGDLKMIGVKLEQPWVYCQLNMGA